MTFPNPSQTEILIYASPIVFLVGFLGTGIVFFKKGFENETVFLFHRNLWFVICLLLAGLIVSDFETFYPPPFVSILFLSILLITTVFPATFQYRKKHSKYSGVFPSFCLFALLAISLYLKHNAYVWLHNDQIARLEEEYQKQRVLDKKGTTRTRRMG